MESVLERTEELIEARDFVRETFSHIDWPTPVKEPIRIGRFNPKPVDGYYALCDAETGELFQFVSDDYALVTNEEITYSVYKATKPLIDHFGEPNFAFSFPNFKNAQSKAKFTLKVDFPRMTKDVRKGDPVCPQIVVKNSYDKTWKHSYEFGILELVCTNGLMLPKKDSYIFHSKKHIGNVTGAEVGEHFNVFLSQFDDVLNAIASWDSVKLDLPTYGNVWEVLPFSEKEKEKIENLNIIGYDYSLEQRKGETLTLWDVSKATTQYLTHEMRSQVRAENVNAHVTQTLAKFAK